MSEANPALLCADLAMQSLAEARRLLDPTWWDDQPAVSVQPQRTIWQGLRPMAGSSDAEPVCSVRCVGRVSGAPMELISALVVDHEFHMWREEHRQLVEVIVPELLWVTHETVLEEVPNIQRRDFVCICTSAEQPDGANLLIERSIQDDAWPDVQGTVRGSRFCAVSVRPVAATSSSGFSAAVGPGVEGDSPPEVEVTLVLQVDLGSIAERFTSQYVLESADLVNALACYMLRPQWPDARLRLEQHGRSMPPPLQHGRLSPPLGMPSDAAASGRVAHDAGIGAEEEEVAAEEAEDDGAAGGGAVLPAPPISADSELHRAQVMALTQLRGTRG